MNKNLAVILAALLTGLLLYGVFFRTATEEPHSLLQTSGGEMEWLRREFQLEDTQFARIRTLHENYDPVCMQLCDRVSQANERLELTVRENRTFSPAVEQALKAAMSVQEECRSAMLNHLYAVSREMSPDQGARYLRTMLPYVIEPSIRGAASHRQHCH